MKRGRLLLLLAVFSLGGLVLFTRSSTGTKSSYEDFASRQTSYFAEVAHACDSLLTAHQGMTNRFLKLAGNAQSLPDAVRRLNASEVRVYPNRVWIGFDAEKDAFAILWEAQSDDPQSWTLITDLDGYLNPVYVERK